MLIRHLSTRKKNMQFTEVTTNIPQHSYFCQHGKIKQQYHTAAWGQGLKRSKQSRNSQYLFSQQATEEKKIIIKK